MLVYHYATAFLCVLEVSHCWSFKFIVSKKVSSDHIYEQMLLEFEDELFNDFDEIET